MLPRLAGLSSTLLSGGGAETHSGSGVWLVFSLRTLVCPDGICGRVRTFVVTRVPCSVVNSLFAHSTHTDASKGPAPQPRAHGYAPRQRRHRSATSAWQPIPAQVGSNSAKNSSSFLLLWLHVLTTFRSDPVWVPQSCAHWLSWLRRALWRSPPLDRARYVHAPSTPRALAHLTQPSARTPSLQGSIFNTTSAPPCAEHSRTGRQSAHACRPASRMTPPELPSMPLSAEPSRHRVTPSAHTLLTTLFYALDADSVPLLLLPRRDAERSHRSRPRRHVRRRR